MRAYAARTTTVINRRFLERNGWRLMISAAERWDTLGMPYALDNGAWKAYRKDRTIDLDKFLHACSAIGSDADFIVAPDIVKGGRKSLDLSLGWLDCCLYHNRLVLLPVQNGMATEDVAPHLSKSVGIFIGGDDEFKEGTMFDWADLAHRHSAYIHCGRVNSLRRLLLCQQAGIDSFDGSGPAKFLKHAKIMDRGLRQGALVWRGNLTERKDRPGALAAIQTIPAK